MARGSDERRDGKKPNAGASERGGVESDPAGKREAANEERVQGEGDYEAAREYNDATQDFVKSGRVDDAARKAAPADAAEAEALKQAETAGKSRAKEEDPAVDHGRSLGGERGGKQD